MAAGHLEIPGKNCRTCSIFTLQRAAISTVRLTASGISRNTWAISFGRLEIKLVGGKLHAVRVAHRLAGLDAEQDFLRVSVVVMQVVAIVGGNEGNTGFSRKPDQIAIHSLFDFKTLILNLEKEILLAEDVAKLVGVLAGLIEALLDDVFSDRAAQARGQRNQSLAVLREKFVIDPGLVVKAFQEAGGNQLNQIAIASMFSQSSTR